MYVFLRIGKEWEWARSERVIPRLLLRRLVQNKKNWPFFSLPQEFVSVPFREFLYGDDDYE